MAKIHNEMATTSCGVIIINPEKNTNNQWIFAKNNIIIYIYEIRGYNN